MIIKNIKLTNFKNFTNASYEVDNITLFKGENGTGKSTLALESLIFALYGYTFKDSLASLPTRDKSKSCTVEITLIINHKEYTIIRSYPTKLVIKKEEENLSFASNTEAQNYINRLLGDRLNFMKFRIIDAYSKETDILSQGESTIKKILFSTVDDTLNILKSRLNTIKYDREIFNRDKAVVYTIYPSEKRLLLISSKLEELNKKYSQLNKDISQLEREAYTDVKKKASLDEKKRTFEKTQKALQTDTKCYACHQPLSKTRQQQMLNDLKKEIVTLEQQMPEIEQNIQLSQEIIEEYKKNQANIQKHKEKLQSLKMKLEARIQQREFKYTNKDVLIAKEALKELDKLSSYYLTESVRILKPIINSILGKIGFTVDFTIDERDKFMITLQKDEITYKFKDLSTGQKLMLQIAFKLAILLSRNEIGIIVADEGMSSLDDENLTHILKIFEDLPFQLFIVIHRFENVPNNVKVIDLNKEEE